MNILISCIIIFIMILLSAFFSGSESSFNSANKLRLKKSAESGEKTAKLAYEISENFTVYLSTILIGNNLVNIAASSVSTVLIVDLLEKVLAKDTAQAVGSTLATILLTIIILIFGEILPKIAFKYKADSLAPILAWPIKILSIILYPIVALVLLILKLIRPIWGKDREEDAPTVTEEELSTIIDTVEEEGIIDEDQGELLQSTLEFSDTTVEEIMTPRTDCILIDIEDDKNEIDETIENSIYSRLPVFEDNVDNIIGILSINNYFKAKLANKEVNIREMLNPVCFVHKTMKIANALDMMKEKKNHLAIVIDEFGGTMGIVTMEDILEELVGDIWDENDEIVSEITKTGDNTYEVNGDMNIDDFFEEIEFDISDDFECEYSTVGGWAIEMLDSNPHVGDSFTYENLYLVVTEMDDLRVTKLMLLIKEVEKDDEDEE